MRETYAKLGLPRHPKKGGEQQLQAELQGAWVDGKQGVASPTAEKVVRYLRLACEAFLQGLGTLRQQAWPLPYVWMQWVSGLVRAVIPLSRGFHAQIHRI